MTLTNIFGVLFFIFTIVSSILSQQFPKVKIENGELKGTYRQSRDGKEYSAYLGIPYAEQAQRFKLAKPAKPWSGIREAVEFGEVCAQTDPFSRTLKIIGSEDCLFLNVYSPQLDGNLPVMVFIHGGGFVSGGSNQFKEEYFMDEKVILVTLNYRLGPFGFLNTEDGAVEANLGLKDQVLALQFLQKNIKAFGGDPSKVTIFGESAGGSLVHHHVLSPVSKGLFSKAIAQSGTAVGNWGVMHKPRLPAFKLGKLLNCFPENSEQTSEILLECLKNKTTTDIIEQDLNEWFADYWLSFAPSIEKPGKSDQIFLADYPINILKSGNFNKVPIIFTVCKDEGLLINSLAVVGNETLTKDINDDYLKVLPLTLNYKNGGYYPYEQNWMSSQIKEFYFGPNKIDKSTMKNLTDLYSDRLFFHGNEKSIALHSKHGKTFNGLFTFEGNWSLTSMFGVKEVLGTAHGDELQYFFNDISPPITPNSREERVSKAFVKLWASFASTDDPLTFEDQSWDAVDPSEVKKQGISYFSLDLPPKVLQNPFKERMEFWDNLIQGARPGNIQKINSLL